MATRRIKRTPRKSATVTRSTRKSEDQSRSTVTVQTAHTTLARWTGLVLVLMALILAFGLYLIIHKPQTTDGAATAVTQTENEISYQGVEGKNAVELLRERAVIETKTYEGLGELVIAINGKASTENQFWVFYINGAPAEVGASTYITKATDVLTWKYENAQ
ncbi:MAG: DUF4430 domain-containing protein [Candidatus Berkelbacteria bacterium]|nr:MAG: DUF4430 domain-containing protein [Candidatus Berkelbacteria bacterium]QQG51980.1 MAG: DUF4430 domain-containing protein [Candidatus Berkelbacteria bacterium]